MPTPAIASISQMELAQGVKEFLLSVANTLDSGEKNDPSTLNPSVIGQLHGPGGLFTYPGVDPDVYSTVMINTPGILNEIPFTTSQFMTPAFEVWTGVGGDTGNNPTYICSPGKVGGVMSEAKLTAPFGLYTRTTRPIAVQRLGQMTDRADPMDLRLVNKYNTRSGIPGINPNPSADIFVNELGSVMFERALSFHRELTKQAWIGNPTNNNAGGGYKEFAGISTMLSSTQKDAETGATVAALAPQVRDFGSVRVDSNFATFIAVLRNQLRQLEWKAESQGFDPVRWTIFMRQELFYALTELWPCAYFTTLCGPTTNGGGTSIVQNVDAADQLKMRDDMRAGKYLMVDGKRWDVATDHGIPETEPTAGCFKSDVFILPMSVLGGRAVLYGEAFPFDNAQITRALNYFGSNAGTRTIGSYWIEHQNYQNGCFEWTAQIQPRLVLRTPWLAARINNVVYCPVEHLTDPFPEDPYYVAGGNSTGRYGPSLTNPWA